MTTVINVYADVVCPFAYIGLTRLLAQRAGSTGRVCAGDRSTTELAAEHAVRERSPRESAIATPAGTGGRRPDRGLASLARYDTLTWRLVEPINFAMEHRILDGLNPRVEHPVAPT